MSCFHPIRAWLPVADLGDGLRPVFRRPVVGKDYERVGLPCKKCEGCLMDRARDFGIRAAHEAQMHKWSCFVTLTYSPEHLPFRGMLKPKDYFEFRQKMKNHRRDYKLRFLGVGEYGSKTWRPHFHVCVFGHWFFDAVRAGMSSSGFQNYESKTLTEMWGKGRAVINVMGSKIAAYAARYSLKKVGASDGYVRTDPRTGVEYKLPPEFMSASKQLGKAWLEKYYSDVWPHDFIVMADGAKAPVPRYYERVLREWSEDDYQALCERKRKRGEDNFEQFCNSLADRLAVRKECMLARLQFSKRGL